ncbi:CxC ATPase DNA modification system associated small protein [Planktothrix agardhii]|uniref:CxC ATPase DNA modification system associated small protein n=1 Tax=Planktothrix agardhii TaxID=1160 RepID=UPI00040B21D3|nr:CxC ATPase DNA modification system associated small protein [Planktothrix agardhii]
MSIDSEIEKAIKASVHEVGQPEVVSDYLIAWLRAMSNSDLSATDNSKHLNLVYKAINIEGLEKNYED